MKKTILLLLTVILAGCQKETIHPVLPKINTQPLAQAPVAYVRIQMYVEGMNTDATLIVFKPTAQAAYLKNEDAIYFFSPWSLANFTSLSSDHVPLSINSRPYLSNDTIQLRIYPRYGGHYQLRTALINAPYAVSLLDNGIPCHLDQRFVVDLKDTLSYYNRFKLVVK